jgi:D-alanine transaminase
MARLAYVDGDYVSLYEPSIFVEDRGYQFSDGVYEVFALRNGVLCDEALHLDRLARSLHEMNMPAPVSRNVLQHIIRETIRKNRVRDGIVYLQITRGVARRDHVIEPDLRPVLVVTVRPSNPTLRARVRKQGIRVKTMPDQRWARCDIKSISLLPNTLAKNAARSMGADDAWLVDDKGKVTEAASANAWIIDAKGNLRTRAAGHDILNGITRQVIFEMADKLGLKIIEKAFSVAEAQSAKECFSTASTLNIFPVISIDGVKIGNGRPGKIALSIAKAYDAINV